MAKWYQKASVQTAIVSGFILVIISLSGALFSLHKENLNLKNNIKSEIETGIDNFIKEVMKANLLTDEIDLKPNLMTLAETSETVSRINQESNIIANTVNIFKVHRLVMKYGLEDTKDKLGVFINANSLAHKEFLEYSLSLVSKHDRVKRLDNVDYVNEVYKKYIDLINNRNLKRGDLDSYIMNLTLVDFGI
jgi:hypothetical protein